MHQDYLDCLEDLSKWLFYHKVLVLHNPYRKNMFTHCGIWIILRLGVVERCIASAALMAYICSCIVVQSTCTCGFLVLQLVYCWAAYAFE